VNELRDEEIRLWTSLSNWSLPADLEMINSGDPSLQTARWSEEDALLAAMVAGSKYNDPMAEKESDRCD
jgi:hypothetical protein